MAKNFSIELKGIPELNKFLKGKDKEITKDVKKGIVRASVFLQGEVKESIAGRRAETISVDTGRFLNSVEFGVSKFEGKVFSKLPYADKLEFGTNFKNSPRRHFRNSASRSTPKIVDILKKAIKNI